MESGIHRHGIRNLQRRIRNPKLSWITLHALRGEERGTKSLFSLLSEPISPSSLLFEPISPFSLNVYLIFSPSSLIFPPISPCSQLFLGHFSLLPILFLTLCIGAIALRGSLSYSILKEPRKTMSFRQAKIRRCI